MTQSTTPFLWFRSEAEEAARFYTRLFPRSKLIAVHRMPGPGPAAKRPVLTVEFVIDGLRMVALNGNADFKATPATSFSFSCRDQGEIDRLWKGLTTGGGAESMCGWCVDRYGYSWQVVPENISALLQLPGALQRMFKMKKLDIAGLKGEATSTPTKRATQKTAKKAAKKPTKKTAKTAPAPTRASKKAPSKKAPSKQAPSKKAAKQR